MRTRLVQYGSWLAYASAVLSLIGLLSHIPIYVSGAVVPFTRSHSVPVESKGVANFFTWFLFALAVYFQLGRDASRLARWGLVLGVVGTLYLSVLHLLFVFEVLWFSDSIALFLLGGGAWAAWLITVSYLSRARWNRTQGQSVVNVLLTIVSILAYPLWPILTWRRITSAQFA